MTRRVGSEPVQQWAEVGALDYEAVTEELNRLFAEEIETAIRCVHLQAAVKGLNRLLVQQSLQANLERSIRQAQAVAGRMTQLGALPALDLRIKVPPAEVSGDEAIRTLLVFAQGVLDGYRDLLEKVSGDVVLEQFVRERLSDQAAHVAELYRLVDT